MSNIYSDSRNWQPRSCSLKIVVDFASMMAVSQNEKDCILVAYLFRVRIQFVKNEKSRWASHFLCSASNRLCESIHRGWSWEYQWNSVLHYTDSTSIVLCVKLTLNSWCARAIVFVCVYFRVNVAHIYFVIYKCSIKTDTFIYYELHIH